MDWTFTTKKEAIDGTKSGKYYAAVVIPKDFSTRMMTFFTADGDHATLTYYNNEKKNALAPKITGQGADTVAAQINEMFSATLTSTALNIASQLADELDKPKSQATLTNFSNNMGNFANTLNDTSSALTTFSSLTLSAQNLLDSSNSLLSNVSGSAKNAVNELKQSKNGINDLTGAVKTSTNALSTALSSSSNSFGAVSTDIDSVFNNAGTQAGNTATALRNQAANVSKQAQGYQNIYDALDELSNNNLVPEVAKIAINHLKTNVGATITQLNDLANSLNTSADNIDAKVSDTTADRERVSQLAQQAKASIDGIKTDFDSQLKPQLNDISDSISSTATALSSTATDLKGALGDLNSTTKSAGKQLTNIRTVLDSTAESLTKASTALVFVQWHAFRRAEQRQYGHRQGSARQQHRFAGGGSCGPRPGEAHGCVPCGEFRLAIGSVLHDSAVVRGIAAYGRNTQDHGVAQES